jgi:hypothetical protein
MKDYLIKNIIRKTKFYEDLDKCNDDILIEIYCEFITEFSIYKYVIDEILYEDKKISIIRPLLKIFTINNEKYYNYYKKVFTTCYKINNIETKNNLILILNDKSYVCSDIIIKNFINYIDNSLN